MFHNLRIFKLLLLLSLVTFNHAGPVQLVRDLLQYNVFGRAILHRDQNWEFDPEVGARRSKEYQALNGRLGEKAIERLGLGVDGYSQERLSQQRSRDKGHLNGLDGESD